MLKFGSKQYIVGILSHASRWQGVCTGAPKCPFFGPIWSYSVLWDFGVFTAYIWSASYASLKYGLLLRTLRVPWYVYVGVIDMPFAMWIRRDPKTHVLDGNAHLRQLVNTMDRSRRGGDGWDVQNGWTDQDAIGGRLMWSQGAMHWIGVHTGATWQIRWIHLCGNCDVICSYQGFFQKLVLFYDEQILVFRIWCKFSRIFSYFSKK